ncbi:MAG TPA: hypothetical protein VKM55_09870 [Candidatus Lokiarchaeia archaeon]|nr:hypothetical protein [Candidatus Lokiarchaeia archaeon]
MNLPKDLELLLGQEESSILKAINRGLPDVNSIHLLTGIPQDCVERKISALVDMKLVKLTKKGYIIRDDKASFFSKFDGMSN